MSKSTDFPSIKINIAEPCQESWGAMRPVSENESFCSKCEKSVVDYTKLTDHHLFQVFSGQNKDMCGRFTSSQLNRPIREYRFEQKKRWMATFAALWAMVWNYEGMAQNTTKGGIRVRKACPTSPESGSVKTVPLPVVQPQAQVWSVKDAHTKVGVPGAKIYFFNDQNKQVLELTSDKLGNFKLPDDFTTKGLRLDARAIYYEPYQINLTEGPLQHTDILLKVESRMMMGGMVAPVQED